MTRPVVAVDLAAKFSAGVCLDSNGTLQEQWDSYACSHSTVAVRIVRDYLCAISREPGLRPIVVIEDLPPHVPSSMITKSVAQLQGRILHEFTSTPGQWIGHHALDNVYFVPPAYWQRDMGVWKASTDVAETVAAQYGYQPPDLVLKRHLEVGKRGTATVVREAIKQRTDYVSAYLIAQWTRMCMAQDRTWDMAIVKNYGS